MARFAKRVRSIEPSPTVRISDLIAESQGQGKKILSLAIGEPDFPTPAHIVDAAKKALDNGYTKYTAAPGIRELRAAIAEKSQKENGIPAKPENVIVAPTKHTLFMTFMALLESADEALIPDPGRVAAAPLDGMCDRTVTVNGFSKTYSMTGWRLGWLVAPTPMYKQIVKVQEHTITCATAFAQKAGVAALRGPTGPLKVMVDEFRARRDIVLRELKKIDRLATDRPRGAFYVFPRVDVGVKSPLLAERILKEAGVAVSPGGAFGFHERKDQRMKDRDGRITHAELRLGKGRVFLATPTPDHQSPKHHRETCAAARKWSSVPWVIDGLLVHVDDVDRHFARAKSEGATMLSDLEDNPVGRLYRAEDLEGHRWMFLKPHA